MENKNKVDPSKGSQDVETKEGKIETVFTKFPCPVCGVYYEPYLTRKDGKAMLECPNHGLFETSIATSKNFRIFCAKLGSAPNRSPTYYTSSEAVIQRFLVNQGLKEGLEFFHNSRVGPFLNGNKHKVYFWCDFVVPKYHLILEASPRIWHKLWNREQGDNRKELFLGNLGWKVINLDEKDLNQLNKIRKETKYPKTERVKEVYEIFGCQEKYVK